MINIAIYGICRKTQWSGRQSALITVAFSIVLFAAEIVRLLLAKSTAGHLSVKVGTQLPLMIIRASVQYSM